MAEDTRLASAANPEKPHCFARCRGQSKLSFENLNRNFLLLFFGYCLDTQQIVLRIVKIDSPRRLGPQAYGHRTKPNEGACRGQDEAAAATGTAPGCRYPTRRVASPARGPVHLERTSLGWYNPRPGQAGPLPAIWLGRAARHALPPLQAAAADFRPLRAGPPCRLRGFCLGSPPTCFHIGAPRLDAPHRPRRPNRGARRRGVGCKRSPDWRARLRPDGGGAGERSGGGRAGLRCLLCPHLPVGRISLVHFE